MRIPVPRHAVGPEGTIADPTIREQIVNTLATLVCHAADRGPHASR